MVKRPTATGKRIVMRSGEAMFGGQPVFDGKDPYPRSKRQLCHDAVMRVDAADRKAAAMEIDQTGARLAASGRRIEARIERPTRAGNPEVAPRDALNGCCTLADVLGRGAQLFSVKL